MKLAALQTATEEISLNSVIYQGLVEKFNNLFIRKDIIEKTIVSKPRISEGSQFYKTLVELAGTGMRTKATVLYVNETGVLVNHDPVIILTVRFHLNEQMMEITAKTVVPRIAIPQAADTITIAYNTGDLSMIAVL